MDERRIDVAPAAIAKVIAAIALVWLWLHLWQLVMIRGGDRPGSGRRMAAATVRHQVSASVPAWPRDPIVRSGTPTSSLTLAGFASNAGRLAVNGLLAILIVVLTMYLLSEGRQTYTWLVAYAPPRQRDRVHLFAYHAAENYYIGPRVYGDRLRLSNLAIIVAFAVGAAIGGIGGALLALPLAALYPVVERVWLAEYLNRDAIATHQRLQGRSSS